MKGKDVSERMEWVQPLNPPAHMWPEQLELLKSWLRETMFANIQKAGLEPIGEPQWSSSKEPDESKRLHVEWCVEVRAKGKEGK